EAGAGHIGVPAGRVARLERNARANDVRRFEWPGVSGKLQGLAAVACVVEAAGFARRAVCVSASLDRLGRTRRAQVSNAAGRADVRSPRNRAGAWRRELAAARV